METEPKESASALWESLPRIREHLEDCDLPVFDRIAPILISAPNETSFCDLAAAGFPRIATNFATEHFLQFRERFNTASLQVRDFSKVVSIEVDFQRKVAKLRFISLPKDDFRPVPKWNGLAGKYDSLLADVASWSGSWNEAFYNIPSSIDEIIGQIDQDSEPVYACQMLKAFMILKGGLQWNDERVWGQLDRISRKSGLSWAAAASYLLGKYHDLDSSKATDPAVRHSKNLKSLKCFRQLSRVMPGPVPLSSDIEILLPGIRSEAPPEQFAGFSDIGDPTVTMVFPPYRYYAARTIAAVQAALDEGRMDSFAQAVEETRYAVQLRRNQGLDSMFLDINIDLCDAAQKSYVHHTDSSAIDRSVLRERFETIIAQCESRRAIYEIAEAKRLEWRANCWAGIAYATRGSERDYALKQVRHFVERTAKARCGRVSFFKTDGIYHLAHHTEHGDHVADWNAFVDNLMITCAGSQPQNEDRQKCSGVVFLSHNSKDKSFVAEVASSLKKRGIGVWLDQWDLRPGTNWVWELQRIIEECRSAAIFFGGNGLGKWQEKEISALIIEEVDRSLALVSVILPGATPDLKLPSFLRPSQNFDFREADRLKLKNNTDKLIGFLAPRSTV